MNTSVTHRLVTDEQAALLAADLTDAKIIQLEGVELRIGKLSDQTVSVIAFPVTGMCAAVDIPFAGETASI